MNVKYQQGVNLIELMVSMTLGIIMLAGVLQVMVNNKQDFLVRDAVGSLDETGQYMMEMMASDLRNVGFSGCNSTNNGVYENLVSGYSDLDIKEGLVATDGNSSGSTPSFNLSTWHNISTYALGSDSYKGARQSDLLKMWTIVPHGMDVVAINTVTGSNVKPTVGISDETMTAFEMAKSSSIDSLMLLSDCEKSYVVEVVGLRRTSSGGLIILDSSIDQAKISALTPPIEAFFLKGVAYYVGKLSSKNSNPPTLYMATLGSNGRVKTKQPLVEGVANIQFLFGESTSASIPSVNRYVSADQVNNWSRVASVRISMLLETLNNGVVPGTGIFNFYYAGRTYASPDRKLRKEVVSTITLRNRIPGEP